MFDILRVFFQIWLTLTCVGIWGAGTVFVIALLHELWMNWNG
jgi:hypothetical protein